MTISVITPEDAIYRVARSLGFEAPALAEGLPSEVIAQALRRAVHILAPCGKHELENAILQSFAGLGPVREELARIVEQTLEELIVYGDILEMRDAEDDHWSRSALVLRPAPPSFVARKNGSIVVIGVAGDEITPFTPELASRLRHNGGLRIIYPEDGEDLKSLLHEIGLLELPETVWLRVPKLETAAGYLAEQRLQLAKEQPSGAVEGMRILDSSRSPAFYRDRWTDASPRHEGIFVARRPQRYGSALWCLVELQGGVVRRFVDLHSLGGRIRPCDIAWRIQMAIDAESGTPQSVRVREGRETSLLDFFSPLPSWAERRLAIVANKTMGVGRLFSYELLTSGLEEEIAFLKKALWLARTEPEASRLVRT
jgi:hypothetical protein